MLFKKNKDDSKNMDLVKIAALLTHAAKIDENYSNQEKEIIKQSLLKIGATSQNIQNIIKEAELIEQNSNQILDFTKEVKNKKFPSKRYSY